MASASWTPSESHPLYGLGFGWIVPAIVGFIVGLIAWKGKGRTET